LSQLLHIKSLQIHFSLKIYENKKDAENRHLSLKCGKIKITMTKKQAPELAKTIKQHRDK
jgi:hypothetical protein